MRAIVMAAGESARWGGYTGVRKQELVIDGERLIDRTLRQLREAGVVDVVVTGDWPDLAGMTFRPDPVEAIPVDGRLGTRRIWNPSGRTVVLMGDVWYSDAAMRAILTYIDRDHHLFARLTPSAITGKPWPEIWADSFWPEDHVRHEAALRRVEAMRERGEIPRAGLWEAYVLAHGGDPRWYITDGCVPDLGGVTVIDDWTEDFDYAVDLDRWLAARAAA